MIKKIVSFLLIAALFAALTGCIDNGGETPPDGFPVSNSPDEVIDEYQIDKRGEMYVASYSEFYGTDITPPRDYSRREALLDDRGIF